MLMRCIGVTLSDTIEPLQVPVPSMNDGSVPALNPIPPSRLGVLTTTREAGSSDMRATISASWPCRPSV